MQEILKFVADLDRTEGCPVFPWRDRGNQVGRQDTRGSRCQNSTFELATDVAPTLGSRPRPTRDYASESGPFRPV
jgi:hypothetical protein